MGNSEFVPEVKETFQGAAPPSQFPAVACLKESSGRTLQHHKWSDRSILLFMRDNRLFSET